MASYKGYSKIVVCILIISFTVATADDIDMMNCLNDMVNYCKANISLPTFIHCFDEAIHNWLREGFPEGLVKQYYLTFGSLLNPDNIRTPEEFCRKAFDRRKCRHDLRMFTGNKKDILSYALYSTNRQKLRQTEDTSTSVDNIDSETDSDDETDTSTIDVPPQPLAENRHSLYYLTHIKVRIDLGLVKSPAQFCQDNCYA